MENTIIRPQVTSKEVNHILNEVLQGKIIEKYKKRYYKESMLDTELTRDEKKGIISYTKASFFHKTSKASDTLHPINYNYVNTDLLFVQA